MLRWMYTPDFIYLFLCQWAFGRLHIWVIVNSAAMNMVCKRLMETLLSIPLGASPEEALRGHMVILFLVVFFFSGTAMLVSPVLALLCFPTNSVQGFNFFTSARALTFNFFDYSFCFATLKKIILSYSCETQNLEMSANMYMNLFYKNINVTFVFI